MRLVERGGLHGRTPRCFGPYRRAVPMGQAVVRTAWAAQQKMSLEGPV
ncbi:hypothetical protein SCH4B_0361 [Ruegeria sp. TrichCH4B]|nr:hypothetical protein SCH4B_0361 [Ruegeria sp. TrichCH4B]